VLTTARFCVSAQPVAPQLEQAREQSVQPVKLGESQLGF
jgi:hypothetical protein